MGWPCPWRINVGECEKAGNAASCATGTEEFCSESTESESGAEASSGDLGGN